MIDVGKLLTGDNPNTEALMKEVYDFEESLAKVSRTVILNTLYTVLHGLLFSLVNNVYCLWFDFLLRVIPSNQRFMLNISW